jgi:hypothetical protein
LIVVFYVLAWCGVADGQEWLRGLNKMIIAATTSDPSRVHEPHHLLIDSSPRDDSYSCDRD